jgi:hypothetical protein
MNEARTVETYRNFELVAAPKGGSVIGAIWRGGLAHKLTGSNTGDVLIQMRTFVDDFYLNRARSRQGPPEANEYVAAFQKLLLTKRAPSDWGMLKANYHAPECTITTTELAKAVSFKSFGAVNLRYGLFGEAVYEHVPVELPFDEKREKLVFTFALATGVRMDKEQWSWTLRPEVAAAMEQLGLDA